MITDLDHITVNVRDKEKSIRFYSDILQLPLINSVNMGDHELT